MSTQNPQQEQNQQEEKDLKFSDFPFAESIQEDIRAAGFTDPLPIQKACIPPAMEGKDVIGLAQTGQGKTAAFALPIIQKVLSSMEMGAVVLAPTRELAAQITEAFNQLGRSSGVRVATIVGGMPFENDERALKDWPNVLVATPGRLIDHIENWDLSLSEVKVLAVDEADRMHDMGFIPQIRRIIAALPKERQTLMFTATMEDDVEQIARQSMRDPVRLQIGVTAPAHRAKQELYFVAEDGKPSLLAKLLDRTSGRVLVFSRTKRGVERLARKFSRRFGATRIHGDMDQPMRDKSLSDFRQGRKRVLFATDIAARGLDISEIEHVINYDFPHNPEDYVHRVGRTARVEASGLATSFITRADGRFVAGVRKLIGDKLPQMVHPDGSPVSKEQAGGGSGGGGKGGKRSRGGRRRRGGRNGSGKSRPNAKNRAKQRSNAG